MRLMSKRAWLRRFPVPYQWRRVGLAAGAAALLAGAGAILDGGLAVQIGLVLVYPLVLLAMGFFEPAERRRLRSLVARRARPVSQ